MKDQIKEILVIFKETFPRHNGALTNRTMFTDIMGWDSLSRINLILALEKAFDVRFTSREISLMRSIADLERSIAEKTS